MKKIISIFLILILLSSPALALDKNDLKQYLNQEIIVIFNSMEGKQGKLLEIFADTKTAINIPTIYAVFQNDSGSILIFDISFIHHIISLETKIQPEGIGWIE